MAGTAISKRLRLRSLKRPGRIAEVSSLAHRRTYTVGHFRMFGGRESPLRYDRAQGTADIARRRSAVTVSPKQPFDETWIPLPSKGGRVTIVLELTLRRASAG